MKNLSPTYHFNTLSIQPNTEGLPVENTSLTYKVTWLHSPSALASVWQLLEFRLGAAPGNRTPCKAGHSDINSYTWSWKQFQRHLVCQKLENCHPRFTPKFLKLKLNLSPPPLFEMHAEEFIHSSAAFPKNNSAWNHSKAFPISALKSTRQGHSETKLTLNKFAYLTLITLDFI